MTETPDRAAVPDLSWWAPGWTPDPTLTVTIKDGLSFACPRCGAFAYRTALGSDVFAAPAGHSKLSPADGVPVIRCHFDWSGQPWQRTTDWRVLFADTDADR